MAIVLVLMAFLFLSVLITAGLLGGSQEPRTINDGRRLLDAGEAQAARKVFERLARQRSPNAPGREPALFWLGRTLEELGRFDDARRVYLKYLQDYDSPGTTARASPQVLSRVRERLAELLRGAGGEPTAWTAFQREAEAASTSTEFKLLGLPEARRFMEEGRFDPARRVLEQLVDDPASIEPARENALYLLGLAHEGMGRAEEALRSYRRYAQEYGPGASRRATPRIQTQVTQRIDELEAELEGGKLVSAWEQFQRQERSRSSRRTAAIDGPSIGPLTTDAPVERQAPPMTVEEVQRDLKLLDVGVRVGDYVLAEKLGEGGMGEVFRALMPVAIKFARTPEAVEHLRRFGALQSAIKSSRIVKPLKVDLEADPPYVVMEFVDGPTLRELLRVRERLEPPVALNLLLEVARGLRDAHLAGVLHLDLKPENVLLDESGSVKLTDFELGRIQGESSQLRLSLSFRSKAGEGLAGTLAYMSPEQRAGKVPDVRSDVYTFGVMLFEALTGTLPEPGDRPSDFVEDLPHEVDAIFERCFARLERRYVEAGELVRELERVVASLPVRTDLAKVFADVPRAAVEGAVPQLLRGVEPRRRLEVEQFERALRDAIERASPQQDLASPTPAAPVVGAAPEAAAAVPTAPEVVAPEVAVPDAAAPQVAAPQAVADDAVESPARSVVAPAEAGVTAPSVEVAASPGDDRVRRPDLDAVVAARRVVTDPPAAESLAQTE